MKTCLNFFPSVPNIYFSMKKKIDKMNDSVNEATENLLKNIKKEGNKSENISEIGIKKDTQQENNKVKLKQKSDLYRQQRELRYFNSCAIYTQIRNFIINKDLFKEILLLNHLINGSHINILSEIIDFTKLPYHLKIKKIKEIDKQFLKCQLETTREQAFSISDIVAKTRPHSIANTRSRENIKIQLIITQKVGTKTQTQTLSSRKIINPLIVMALRPKYRKKLSVVSFVKGAKARSNSFEYLPNENNLQKFYEAKLIETDNKQREEIAKQVKAKEKSKILEVKNAKLKNKYYVSKGVQRDNDKMFKIYMKLTDNSNKLLEDRDRSVEKMNRRRGCVNIKGNHNRNNSSLNGSSSNLNNNNNNNNNNNSNLNGSSSNLNININSNTFRTSLSHTPIKMATNRSALSVIRDSKEIREIKNMKDSIEMRDTNNIPDMKNALDLKNLTNQILIKSQGKTQSSYNHPSQTTRLGTTRLLGSNDSQFRNSTSSFFPNSSQFSNFASGTLNFKKLNLTKNNILNECKKASDSWLNIKCELENMQDDPQMKETIKHTRNLSNSFLLHDLEKDYHKESKIIKNRKRLIVYPRGPKFPGKYLTEDKSDVILVAKQVENIKEDTAFGIRNLLYNKFDIKLGKDEIINYNPDVTKDRDLTSNLKEYQKNVIKNNFLKSEKYKYNLKLKNLEMKRKVDQLISSYRKV